MSWLLAMTQCFLLSPAWGESNLIDHIQQSEKSIVMVRTELTRLMPTNPPRMATFERTAAGLIISTSGIIVTNTHTIIHAPHIFVILQDGTRLPAKLVFTSKKYDFSFLKIKPPYPLQRIRWANSSHGKIGQTVIAVGNADDDNHSIMEGHIKALLKSPSSTTRDFLELDLNLYHGDSGGPILDTEGRLLGIVMAKRLSKTNSSIAIASNKIRQQYLHYEKNLP